MSDTRAQTRGKRIKADDIRAGDELYTSIIGSWKYHPVVKAERGDISVDVTVQYLDGHAVEHLTPGALYWVRRCGVKDVVR